MAAANLSTTENVDANAEKILAEEHRGTHNKHPHGDTTLTWVIWFALMLHKLPPSFAVSTFLLSSGSPQAIHLKILLFSAACPIAALMTAVTLEVFLKEELNENAPGIMLLFSGGTFLYVSTMHVLPEALAPDFSPLPDASTSPEGELSFFHKPRDMLGQQSGYSAAPTSEADASSSSNHTALEVPHNNTGQSHHHIHQHLGHPHVQTHQAASLWQLIPVMLGVLIS